MKGQQNWTQSSRFIGNISDTNPDIIIQLSLIAHKIIE